MYVSNSWEHILNESDDMRPFLNDLIADIGMTSGVCLHARWLRWPGQTAGALTRRDASWRVKTCRCCDGRLAGDA